MLYDLSKENEQRNAEFYFAKLIRENAIIELSKVIPKRSITINKYLHVCIQIFALEFGYTLDEAKTLLKRKCNFMVYDKKGALFLKRTRDLDNKECSEFIEFIRNYAALHDLYIPDAEEYKTNKYTIDREISRKKQYL